MVNIIKVLILIVDIMFYSLSFIFMNACQDYIHNFGFCLLIVSLCSIICLLVPDPFKNEEL